jgi:hypothetical protein
MRFTETHFSTRCLMLTGAPALLVATLLAPKLLAQTEPSPANAPVIRVYVNLLQIPVLVLDTSLRRMPPVPPSQFEVKLEGVKAFRPQRIRLEGDDPISLGILVDVSDPSETLWRDTLPNAIDTLTHGLRSWDRVEIFGMDGCHLRSFGGELLPEPGQIKGRIIEATSIKPYSVVQKTEGPCGRPINLWQSMSYAADSLGKRGGRRVLLALTDGTVNNDEDLTKLHTMLNLNSVTMFSIDHKILTLGSAMSAFTNGSIPNPVSARSRGGSSQATLPSGPEPSSLSVTGLLTQSELSGGMKLNASPASLSSTMEQFLTLLRGRYILEFPRPDTLHQGQYRIEVTIARTRAFIRPAPVTLPIASPEEARDPTVEHGANVPGPTEPAAPTPAP